MSIATAGIMCLNNEVDRRPDKGGGNSSEGVMTQTLPENKRPAGEGDGVLLL